MKKRILFPEIFHIDPWGFIQFDSMQLNPGRQTLHEFLPDGHGQVFGTAHLPSHNFHIQVQILMIDFFDDVFFNDITQLFYIKDEAGIRAGLTFYSYQ